MPSAACVVWSDYGDNNPFILAGIESRYVRDKQETVNIDEIRKRKKTESFANLRLTLSQQSQSTLPMEEFERVARSDFAATVGLDDLTQAKIIFAKRAVALEEVFGTRVQFDTPSFDAGSDSYRVNYRWTVDAQSFGITKGQIEDGETPLQAIVREIGEETGVRLSESAASRLIVLGTRSDCTFFSLHLTGAQVKIWKETIGKRLEKRHGELFDLEFVPKIRLDSYFIGKKMNQKTKIGLKLFSGSPDSPGRSVSSAHGGPASHGHARSGKGGRSRRLRSKKRGLKQKKRAQKSKKRGHV
jgi:8-oxo-dGTP pyrophosphatase MutT (NUDIX family)